METPQNSIEIPFIFVFITRITYVGQYLKYLRANVENKVKITAKKIEIIKMQKSKDYTSQQQLNDL
jgi:hypothetical protein